MFRQLILGILICLIKGQILPANIIVAQDGTGQFRTIGEAINAAPKNNHARFYIRVKTGIYREIIRIGPEKPWLALIGDGMGKTIITGNRSARGGFKTFDSATVGILGEHFLAIDLTFENQAGPQNFQAVAMKSEVESTFYRCGFLGYQDTLYASRGRHFYRECHIYGTVDFIFGNAQAVFQRCRIFLRKPLPGQYNTITAQSRSSPTGNEGIVFHNCYITASPEFEQFKHITKTFFGRNWRPYSRVVIMLTYVDDTVDSRGWVTWDSKTDARQLFYGEYGNRGPGAALNGRPTWVKRLNTSEEAARFDVRNFIQGNQWIPREVPFDLDLI